MTPRIRTIKPAFFKDERLAEQPFEYRLLFAGLWLLADREGRLEDRPKRIKAEVFPYDDVDVVAGISALAAHGFVRRYTIEGAAYLAIPGFTKHQRPHIREAASEMPPPPDDCTTQVGIPANLGSAEASQGAPDISFREGNLGSGEGKGREGKGVGRTPARPIPPAPFIVPPIGACGLVGKCPLDLIPTPGMLDAFTAVGCPVPRDEVTLYAAHWHGSDRTECDWTEMGPVFPAWVARHKQMGCAGGRGRASVAEGKQARTIANLKGFATEVA